MNHQYFELLENQLKNTRKHQLINLKSHTNLGPDESHSVHKLKSTKIVVEEVVSPEVTGSFTFAAKSEVYVEEIGSLTLNAIVEEVESDNDLNILSRGVSIISVASDDKVVIEEQTKEETDENLDDLMERIKKQRNVLADILDENTTHIEEKVAEEVVEMKEEIILAEKITKIDKEPKPEGTIVLFKKIIKTTYAKNEMQSST